MKKDEGNKSKFNHFIRGASLSPTEELVAEEELRD